MALPIKCHEHMQLTNVGIRPATICHTNVTMESGKHIVVNEMDSQQVVIVDISDPVNSQHSPISADSVIMHPSRTILALKSGKTLQIFDIEKKLEVKSLDVENVIFWRWINEETIALISDMAVYHWSINGDSASQKVFSRFKSLAGAKIIGYRADFELQWLVVTFISTENNLKICSMELYDIRTRVSHLFEGYAACFARFKFDSNLISRHDSGSRYGGIKVAFRAYKKFLQRNKDKLIPGFNFSNEQNFFIGYAQQWCARVKPGRYPSKKDPHSPKQARVNIVLSNFLEFDEAFFCPRGSTMNPIKKCKVW